MIFQELDGDQSREFINTEQRFQAYLEARDVAERLKGSMSYKLISGTQYLTRYYYDKNGHRKIRSLGVRSKETDDLKAGFESNREAAQERLVASRKTLERQSGINKVLGLGRVPTLNARIIRALDATSIFDAGVRLIGTNCIFAYEAAAGVHLSSDVTTTEDLDILMDARANIRLALDSENQQYTLIKALRRVDRSFVRTPRTFQAANKDDFLVDLVKPMPNPPWKNEKDRMSSDPEDLVASEIEGLIWHVNSPVFKTMAIDGSGFPVNIIAPDPVAFVVHKLWLSKREDRRPMKRRRDATQAKVVAELVSRYLPQIEFDKDKLRQFPKAVVEQAEPLFDFESSRSTFDL